MSLDKRTRNQIDHFAISKKWKRSLLDVRSYGGADIACDHYLIIGLIKLKLAALKPNQETRRIKFNTSPLEHPPTRNSFVSNVEQKLLQQNLLYQNPQEEETASKTWRKIQASLIGASEEKLKRKRNAGKDWITDDTWNKIIPRKEIKNKLNNAHSKALQTSLAAKYKETNKEVKRLARRDKRKWIDDLALMAEYAAQSHRTI